MTNDTATTPLYSRSSLPKFIDVLLIICFSIIPLFLHFPYRVNIFLSWEGAYRLYLGQVPYKDFGLPMGFGYWIVPGIFFKLFGPYLISLVKAQVLLNIVAGLSFRSILKKLNVSDGVRIAAVLVFCLSYILMNFWPWYNNSVIIWEIVALNFLLSFIVNTAKSRYIYMVLGCFFLFLSFFTKQDGGFFAFMIATLLMLYQAIANKKWKDLVAYLVCYFLLATLIILPFTHYSFGYWFNHGQPPHSSRLSIKDLLDEILGQSQWIKFYVAIIIVLLLTRVNNWKQFLSDRQEMLFLLLVAGILFEAAIFQVTSYTPPDNNIFFQSFAAAYIFSSIEKISKTNFSRVKNFCFLLVGVLFWWSGMYWKYFERLTVHLFPATQEQNIMQSATGENVINRHTYMLDNDTTHYEDESTWKEVPGLRSFHKMYLPPSTVAGIGRLMAMPVFKNKDVRVLNMTELTPLDYELGYQLEKSPNYPLWYHLGVAIFNRQTDTFCNRIRNSYYNVVMFEYLPSLNNFYPFRIRDSLLQYYQKADSFLAPRRPTNGTIEIFVRK
ncbi:MAG TPA: hypothetical protein VN721_01910 [Flavipsychrobacter sp.]|nr:hypothetical protein [Flavipsychrobacter sp.]